MQQTMNVNYKHEGGFLSFLKDNGYKPFKNSENNILTEGCAVMSSMVAGGIATLYVHESELHLVDKLNNKEIESTDFKKKIVYGLCEYGHPPTLISPRPRGTEDRKVLDAVFSKVLFEDILKAMFDKSIIFDIVREMSIPNDEDYQQTKP